MPLPRPTLGPCQPGLAIAQLRPIPGPFPNPPTPFNGSVLAGRGRVIPPGDGCAQLVGTLHSAVQKLGAHTTTCWSMIHVDLQPGHGDLCGLLKRRPPGGERSDDASPWLGGTATGDVELPTL